MTREEAIKIIDCYDIGFYDLSGEKIPAGKLADAFDMAIEALSRSGDLISRADAIEAWDKLSKRGRTEFDQVLMTLPSADAVSREECDECKTDKEGVLLQQLAELQGDYETMKNSYEDALADAEWIPCSERLPKIGQKVLASTKRTVFTQVFKGFYSKPNAWHWEHNTIKVVTAWMPLPEPYREDGEV